MPELSQWEELGLPVIEYTEAEQSRRETAANSTELHKKHYRELDSIDWAFEYKQSSLNKKERHHLSSITAYIRRWSKWLVLIGTGVFIGTLTACLDFLYKWLTDLKDGICRDGFYMTHSSCCKDVTEGDVCEAWRQWDEIIHLNPYTAGSFIYKYFLYIVTSFILAFVTAHLVKNSKYVRNSGISEVKTIINGVVLNDFLSIRTLIIKWIGLTLIVSSGIWAGKEGPLVHISCSCATLLMSTLSSSWASNEAVKREILVAASAAGISVAFNTPVGGVLFALEQLTSYFAVSDKMWTSFVCAMSGVVILNTFKEGAKIYVTMDNQWLSIELIGFLILGVLGGAYGHLFNWLNIKFADFRKKNIEAEGGKFEVLEILALSIVSSILTFPLVFPRLPLTTLIGRLYKDCGEVDQGTLGGLCDAGNSSSVLLLILSGIVGTLLTTYTFGTIVPAGVLMPTLVIGAITGRVLGIFVEYIQGHSPYLSELCENSSKLCISPGAYAVVGSAAFLTGVTKMTVWVVVTVFEMTGALTYVLPIMISVLIARLTNDKLDEFNCYDQWIKFLEYPYLHESNKSVPLIKAEKFMKKHDIGEISTVYAEDQLKLGDLEQLLKLRYQGLPVLESRQNPFVLGWLSLSDLRAEYTTIRATSNDPDSTRVSFVKHDMTGDIIDLSYLVEHDFLTLNPNLELPTLLEIFFKMKSRFVLFGKDGVFKGLLTLKDVTKVNQLSTQRLLLLDDE